MAEGAAAAVAPFAVQLVPAEAATEDDDEDEAEAGLGGDVAASGSGLPVRRRLAGALGATLDERHAGHTQAAASLRTRGAHANGSSSALRR